MSEDVYEAIAKADSGFVESPAGCGKTEAIVRTVGSYCTDTQLVLTHTHAGVDAIRERFGNHSVPSAKYHIDTIAGWAWGWVRRFPRNALYEGSTEIPNWNVVYAAMTTLLNKEFVVRGILNSYAGVIVDEYQDCTGPMHELIARLNTLLPCRILGDELQGVFDFNREPLVTWVDVRREFQNDLGVLDTPHRWIKAGNRELGQWLLDNRSAFWNGFEPDYGGSPVHVRHLRFAELVPYLIRLTHQKDGSICIVRAKAHKLNAALESALVKHGYSILEANDLGDLRKLILALTDGTPADSRNAVFQFIKRAHGGLQQDDQRFIKKIIAGKNQKPRRADRQALCVKYGDGLTPALLYDLLAYCDRLEGVLCKLDESVGALRCILEEHLETGADLKKIYADEIARRRYHSRRQAYRSIGSTLLVKGLEFDHAVILRQHDWQTNWGGYKDLYVALTRGSKSATVIDVAA